jgi:hypothetical protein
MGNGNDEISTEEHYENSKTRRGSYLGLKLVIFVQISKYLNYISRPSPFIAVCKLTTITN